MKTKVKHRQSKYITLMMIPDSTARVRSIRIPRWVFGAVIVPLLCIGIIAALFRFRVINLESRLYYSSARLSETIGLNQSLEETISIIENSRDASALENEYYQARLYETQQKVEGLVDGLLEQSEAIGDMTQRILDVFAELDELGLPFSFDEILLRAAEQPTGGAYQGGPYGGGGHNNGPVDTLSELDAILAAESLDLQILMEYAEELRSFFRYRPTGWPVSYRHISSGFGNRPNPFTGEGVERHLGIDIRTPTGTEVFATAYGVVQRAGWNESGYGLFVIIEHGYGYSTVFAHNSVLLVSEGDTVERGQVIALSGNTGRSTGPHVHYEVRHNNIPRDPARYLN